MTELELVQIRDDWRLGHCTDDPVRPHLPLAWRVSKGREVYGLEDENSVLQAVICVAYCTDVPLTEAELDRASTPEGSTAVFYTVWSYAKGAGREMVLRAADHIHKTRGCSRYVTLSPLTEMAEKFHIRNGARLLTRGDTCQNFEYTL